MSALRDGRISASITTVLENGRALLADAQLLFGWDRFSTALALSILAQEEFSKAFMLQLVSDGRLPWLPEVQRAMANHHCKHVVALVLDWLPARDWDNLLEQARHRERQHNLWMAWAHRRSDRYKQGLLAPDPDDPEPIEPEIDFPPDIAAALNIFRHEQIERLRSGNPWKDEDWATGQARRTADGLLDRKKQSALYADITKTGEVGLHPGLRGSRRSSARGTLGRSS